MAEAHFRVGFCFVFLDWSGSFLFPLLCSNDNWKQKKDTPAKGKKNFWNLLSLMTDEKVTTFSPLQKNSLLLKFLSSVKKRRNKYTSLQKSNILLIFQLCQHLKKSVKLCQHSERICKNYTQIRQHVLSAANHPVDWGVWPNACANGPNHYDDYAQDDLKRKEQLAYKYTA